MLWKKIIIAVAVIIVLIFLWKRSEGYYNKSDYIFVRRWLCEWKIKQIKGLNYHLTPQEVEFCRIKSVNMSEPEANSLMCQYNTFVRRMEETQNANYVLTPDEVRRCDLVYRYLGMIEPSMGASYDRFPLI